MSLAFVDFETESIDPRPAYPPKPVGVAVLHGRQKKYYAWGHPTKNNASKVEAQAALKVLWNDPKIELVFHNEKFDLEVALVHMGLALPDWKRVHDTVLLAFLHNPYELDLHLKNLAQRHLNEPPTEKDELIDWIMKNVPEVKRKKSEAMRYVCRTPGDLAGRYAIGDVTRTKGLFEYYMPQLGEMRQAYDRERQLLYMLLDTERQGVQTDLSLLRNDVFTYSMTLIRVDEWIAKRLGITHIDVDKRGELADAIEASGKSKGFSVTKTGRRSTSKQALQDALSDTLLNAVLSYRGSLATFLRTFMQPWLAVAEKNKGRIFLQWHSTRNPENYGARTGRLSSSPNLQNIPTNQEALEKLFSDEKLFQKLKWLPPLPKVRKYIICDSDKHIFVGRDYSSQELRVLGHYEDSTLLEQYNANPKLDVHQFVANMLTTQFDIPVTRRMGKTLNFLKVYGGGASKLAAKLNISVEEAYEIMAAYLQVFPGLKELTKKMKQCEQTNSPIKTLGGRLYYAEAPKTIDRKYRTFGYKLVNYLVQGSSADQTKQAMLDYHFHPKRKGRFVLTVHDELVCNVLKKYAESESALLDACMCNALPMDVPVLTDGKIARSYAELK